MSSSQTTNYGLNQWAAEDRVIREEFNADNAKIDAALVELSAQIPRFVFGTYTGDGTKGRIIELGFMPKAVYVCTDGGLTFEEGSNSTSLHYGGLALPGAPVKTYKSDEVVAITETGFQVTRVEDYNYCAYSNYKEKTYYYAALR